MQKSKIKVVLVGDGGVGKTSQIISYATAAFPEQVIQPVGGNYTVDVKVARKTIELDLWDTAGEEEFDDTRPATYVGADVVLVEFAITSPASFANVIARWAPELKRYCPTTPFLLVGNKTDLKDDAGILEALKARALTPITRQEGEELATRIGAVTYVENSARKQTGLKQVFDEAIKVVLGARRAQSGGGVHPLFRNPKETFGKGVKQDIETLVSLLIPTPDDFGIPVPAEKTVKARLGLTVGEVAQPPKSALKLVYEKEEADAGKEGDVTLTLSFTVKPDVDPFSLGELSGAVKQILSLAKHKDFKYEIKSALTKEEDGAQVFSLIFIWHEAAAYDAVHKLADFYQPKQVEATLELNQEPSVPTDDFLALRAELRLELARHSVLFLESLLASEDSENVQKLWTLLRINRRVALGIEFGSIQELYKETFKVPEEFQIIGWSTIPILLKASPLGRLLLKSSTPEPIRTIYKALSYLKGFHGIKLKAGHHTLKLQATHFDIFTLLPTLKEFGED